MKIFFYIINCPHTPLVHGHPWLKLHYRIASEQEQETPTAKAQGIAAAEAHCSLRTGDHYSSGVIVRWTANWEPGANVGQTANWTIV